MKNDPPEGSIDQMPLDEIEQAYLRAMEATEQAETLLAEPGTLAEESADDLSLEIDSDLGSEKTHTSELPSAHSPERSSEEIQHTTPLQVIEGLLFVGSTPFPAKKLADLLGGSTTSQQVEELLEQLNERYQSESRPYEIRLREGGYQLCLLTEFEPVRRRVYGQGPKEVKLNQDALEVLAYIAYQQPMSRLQLNELGRKNIAATVRQLLRRQLIQIQRDDADQSESYITTGRFLELFGLNSISDLPQAVDFNFK